MLPGVGANGHSCECMAGHDRLFNGSLWHKSRTFVVRWRAGSVRMSWRVSEWCRPCVGHARQSGCSFGSEWATG